MNKYDPFHRNLAAYCELKSNFYIIQTALALEDKITGEILLSYRISAIV